MSNQRMRELFLENIERQRMGGELVAGKRKRKATEAQLAALRKARKAKKMMGGARKRHYRKRGGDFEDVGDSDYKLFGAAYKNPLEKARKMYDEQKKNDEWYEFQEWKDVSKLAKKAALDQYILELSKQNITQDEINAAKARYDAKIKNLPEKYTKYNDERKTLKIASPYIELYKKYGVKPTLAELKALA